MVVVLIWSLFKIICSIIASVIGLQSSTRWENGENQQKRILKWTKQLKSVDVDIQFASLANRTHQAKPIALTKISTVGSQTEIAFRVPVGSRFLEEGKNLSRKRGKKDWLPYWKNIQMKSNRKFLFDGPIDEEKKIERGREGRGGGIRSCSFT